jgi:hypothetical protein
VIVVAPAQILRGRAAQRIRKHMTPHEQPPTMQAPQSAARRTFVLPSRPYRRVARADLSDSKAADAGISR